MQYKNAESIFVVSKFSNPKPNTMKKTLLSILSIVALSGAATFTHREISKNDIRPLPTESAQSVGASNLSMNENLPSKSAQTRRGAASFEDTDPRRIVDDGTRLRYNIVGWSEGGFTGPAEMRPAANAEIERLYKPDGKTISLGGGSCCAYGDGKYYSLYWQSGMGQVMSVRYYVYDAETWELLTEAEPPAQWYSISTDLAYNPADGQMWAIAYDALRRTFLATLNEETGTYNFLVGCSANIKTMAFSADGKLYAITADGELETIDLNTGEGTVVCRVSDEYLYYSQAMAFDYHTGELFWFCTNEDWSAKLSVIDLKTKEVKKVDDLPDYIQIRGAWVESAKASSDDAPAVVASLSADFGESAATEGTIFVTAPSTTFSGETLSGKVNIEIKVDGVSIENRQSDCGEEFSFIHDFKTEGEHTIEAIVSNDAGTSPTGKITTYCGVDTPMPATDIILEIDDAGKAELSWTAPKSGVHGGFFDKSDLRYRIVRNPDNIVVAEALSDETFSETLPGTLNRYSYSITTLIDNFVSETATSNSLVWGDGILPPFEQQLGTDEYFNLCTIYDLDGNGNTFYPTWGSVSCYTGYEPGKTSNDWIITPPITLEKGIWYLETTYSTVSQSNDLTITMGRKATVEAQTEVLKDVAGLIYEDGMQTLKQYIEIDETGKYYFGYNFHSTCGTSTSVPYL